jgi:hypothetical protein
MLLTTMHVSARRAGQTAAHMIAASLTSRARDSQSEYPINTGEGRLCFRPPGLETYQNGTGIATSRPTPSSAHPGRNEDATRRQREPELDILCAAPSPSTRQSAGTESAVWRVPGLGVTGSSCTHRHLVS